MMHCRYSLRNSLFIFLPINYALSYHQVHYNKSLKIYPTYTPCTAIKVCGDGLGEIAAQISRDFHFIHICVHAEGGARIYILTVKMKKRGSRAPRDNSTIYIAARSDVAHRGPPDGYTSSAKTTRIHVCARVSVCVYNNDDMQI